METVLHCTYFFKKQIRKYLIPDANDEIRQEQMREIELMNKLTTAAADDSESLTLDHAHSNQTS